MLGVYSGPGLDLLVLPLPPGAKPGNIEYRRNNLAVGRYLTDANTAYFRDLALYVNVNTLSDTTGQAHYVTDV